MRKPLKLLEKEGGRKRQEKITNEKRDENV